MKHSQQTLMTHDPAEGTPKPYPSQAAQWREWHGQAAFLFNPWTGQRRFAGDVGTDPFGYLILPPGEELLASDKADKAKYIRGTSASATNDIRNEVK